jgi:RsmE family RNA methyltransferase
VNLLLLTENDRVADDRYRVAGDRARHLREILGVAVGETVRAGLLEGAMGETRVVAVDDEVVELEGRLDGLPPPRADVDLVLAIPRPKMLRRLLPQITAMGVDRLVLLRTWRVEKPYLTARILRPEEYRPLLHEGMSQARTTREPRVTIEPLFRPFVEDRAADLFAGTRCLVGHPTAETPLAEIRVASDERVTLAIGPEGGFLPFEIELLRAAGFEGITLGQRTLRVDTASLALLAQVGLLRSQSLLR